MADTHDCVDAEFDLRRSAYAGMLQCQGSSGVDLWCPAYMNAQLRVCTGMSHNLKNLS